MNGASVSFGFDELPPDGRACWVCKELITGKAFFPYIQISADRPLTVEYLWPWCEKCNLAGKDKPE